MRLALPSVDEGLSLRRPSYYTLPLIALQAPFNTQKAAELLEAVWSLGLPAIVSLTATPLDFGLSLTCPAENLLTYQSTLYGVVPELDITPRPFSLKLRDFPTLVSVSGKRHEDREALPMRDVAELKQHDPINRIIEACYPLNEDEAVDIHFFLTPADKNRLKANWEDGFKEVKWWIFRDTVARFDGKTYQEILERLGQFAFDLISVIAISGTNKSRLTQKSHALSAAFASRTTTTGTELRRLTVGIEHKEWKWHRTFSLADIPSSRHRHGTLITASELANLWHLPSDQVLLPQVRHLKLQPVSLPPYMLSAQGIPLGTHHYRGQAQQVNLPLSNLKSTPLVVLGKTGFGKTTVGHQITAHALKNDSETSLVIVDPHRDWVESFALRSIPENQLHKAYFIDFADTAYPIGLPLFRKPRGLSQDAYITDTFETIKLLFKDNWSSTRMETVAYNTVAVLCQLPNASLRDFPRLYSDSLFRKRALSTVTNPAVLEFFNYYDNQSSALQSQITSPVLSRINMLYRSEPIRNITCRPDGLDIPQLLNEGSILLFSFAGAEIEAEAQMLMELIVAKVHLAIKARATIPEDQRRYTIMAIDESQLIKGSSLPTLLTQGRKFGLSLLLLTQLLANWTTQLEQNSIGNTSALITFSLGPDDAKKLAPVLYPFTTQQIMDLDKYQTFAKIPVGNFISPAFHMSTLPITSERNFRHLEIARDNARARFGQPRATVDRLFQTSAGASSPTPSAWEIFNVDAAT